MDLRQAGLGVVLLIVFWAFQAHYFDNLGTSSWVVGAIIFSVVLWLIGKGVMPKAPAEQKELWMFTIAFAVVATAMIAYGGPYLGAVFPANFTPSMLTPLILSFWLIVFGGAMLVQGWQAKWGVTILTGLIWLISSVHFVSNLSTGPNSYLHFGLLVSLPFIIYGLIQKK